MTPHSTKLDARPSMQFYPADWQTDTAVQLCSLGARGLWIEMLCLMWSAPERGCLQQANGKQIEAKGLAKLVGDEQANVKQLLSELGDAVVYSRRCDGTIYSRRMYREWKLSQSRAKAGRKGGRVSKTKAKQPPSSPTPTSSPTSLKPFPTEKGSSLSEPSDPFADPPKPTLSPEEFRDTWNALGKPFPPIRRMTDKRKTALRQRVATAGWAEDLPAALKAAKSRGFLKGENDRGWVMDVDFLLRPDTVTKLMEGKYDDRKATGTNTFEHLPGTAHGRGSAYYSHLCPSDGEGS